MMWCAPKDVHECSVPYLIVFQWFNHNRQPKLKVGQQVEIKQKIETFHRGQHIQFTEEVFTIAGVPTVIPRTYIIVDAHNQLNQGNFYDFELARFEQ